MIMFLLSDMRVSDSSLLGPEFGQNGKQTITIRNLLLHNAGFPPDPKPNYCMLLKTVLHHTCNSISNSIHLVLLS